MDPDDFDAFVPGLDKARPRFRISPVPFFKIRLSGDVYLSRDHRYSNFVQAEREERPGKLSAETAIKSKPYFLTIKNHYPMANVNENLLVRGARGNVGKQFLNDYIAEKKE